MRNVIHVFPTYSKEISHKMIFRNNKILPVSIGFQWGDHRVTLWYARLQYRYAGASVHNRAPRYTLNLYWYIGRAVFQHDWNPRPFDSIAREVKVEGAVVVPTEFPFPWLMACHCTPFWVVCGGLLPGDLERLARSVGFLLPGELVELASLFSLVGQSRGHISISYMHSAMGGGTMPQNQ